MKTIEKLTQRGRPRIFVRKEERAILQKIKKDRRITEKRTANEAEEEFYKKAVTAQSEEYYTDKITIGKLQEESPTSVLSIERRGRYSQGKTNKNMQWRNHVIFSDESKFNITGPKGRIRV